jgi:hypothetical protein
MKPRVSQLAQSGATDGQVITWDNTAGLWVPETPAAGGSLTVQDESGNVGTGVTQIDFQGAGVTASAGTGEVVVTIPGGGADYHHTRNSTSTSSGTVPITNTAVAAMSISIPSLASSRTALVSFEVVFSGSHTNRFFIYVDGVLNWPATNNGVSAVTAGTSINLYHANGSQVPITLGTGAHTIDVYWNAVDATTAVTFIERSVTVVVLP